MKSIILFGLALSLLYPFQSLQAQSKLSDKGKIVQAKKRKLIVILQEEDEKILNKLKRKDPDKVQLYQLAIKELNENIKMSIEANWHLSTEIIYKKLDDAEKLKKAKNKGYAVIYLVDSKMILYPESHTDNSNSLEWSIPDESNQGISEQSKMDHTPSINLALIEELQSFSISSVDLPHQFPTKAELYFGIQFMSWYIQTCIAPVGQKEMSQLIDANSKQLKTLTLIINQRDLSERFDSIAVKSFYKYPVKVVGETEYGQIITNKTEGYAYLCVFPQLYKGISYTPVCMNATSGIPLAIDEIDAGAILEGYMTWGKRGNTSINQRVLESIMKDIEPPNKKN